MALTCEFRATVIERVQRDPEFAQALYDEALSRLSSGEPEIACRVLRYLVPAPRAGA